MQQSRLNLEHYSLLKFHLDPVEGVQPLPLGVYADFSNALLTSSVNLNEFEANGEQRFAVELIVDGRPIEGKPFPYIFSVGIVGIFDGKGLPTERLEALVAANGASMLYGALREQVLSMTSRCVLGPMLLPSVQFADVGEQIEAQKMAAAMSTKEADGAS